MNQTDVERIAAAAAKYPPKFRLRRHKGTFRISLRASYISDGEYSKAHIMLYSQILEPATGAWLDFAKGTVAEFDREVIPLESA